MKLYEFVEKDEMLEFLLHLKLHLHGNKKNILFIEPYGSCLSLVKRAVAKGWNVFLFSAHSDLRILPKNIIDLVTLTIKIDTSNEMKILNLMGTLKHIIHFDAVIPGFEYFVPIATRISQYLNLPSISLNQVMQLRRKDLMLLQLQRVKCNIPQFCIIRSVREIDDAINSIGFPFVCKPVDAAGSVNVKKVNNKAEAVDAAKRIFEGDDILWGHKISNTVLIEEYIEGKEYSVEGVVINGTVIHFSITEKEVFDQHEFIEIGHIVNPPLSTPLKQLLQKYTEEVIAVLGADYCPFHAEIRIDHQGKPKLMEIAARLAGDKIGDLINLSSTNDYFDTVLAAYMGQVPQLTDPTSLMPVGIRFFYRPTLERYNKIYGLEIVKQYQVEDIDFYYLPATPIPAFPKALRRIGHVIIKNSDVITLGKDLKHIDTNIVFC